MTARAIIEQMYAAIDRMDVDGSVAALAENVTFRLGNFDPVNGREGVRSANAMFFGTINGMCHEIEEIREIGDRVICRGEVLYTRKDAGTHRVPFATFLTLDDGKVTDYQVLVDVSGL